MLLSFEDIYFIAGGQRIVDCFSDKQYETLRVMTWGFFVLLKEYHGKRGENDDFSNLRSPGNCIGSI